MLRAAVDGVLSRWATHAVLASIAAAAVAGICVAVWFAQAARTSMLAAAPLLVLAVVAVSACGSEITRHRRGELALARLRGGRRMVIVLHLSLEPMVSLLAGAMMGLVVAMGASAVIRAAWLPSGAGTTLLQPWPAIAVATVVLLSLLSIEVGMLRALKRPLPEQTSPLERPTRLGPWTVFGQALVFVATAVALYQAASDQGSSTWVVYAGPAALGLAGGVLATWIVMAAARLAIVSGRDRVGESIAAGRAARTTDAGGPLILLVAASVVTVVAGGAAVAVSNWIDNTGRLAAGAPLVMRFEGDADAVLSTTEEIDPTGRWVMAGVRVLEDDRPASRRVFLDTGRYARVVGDYLDATPAQAASHAVAQVNRRARSLPTSPRIANGKVVVRASVGDFDRVAELSFRVEYATPQGRSTSTVDLRVPPHQTRTGAARLSGCAEGCTVSAMLVYEGRPCTQVAEDLGLCNRPVVRVEHAVAGGVDLLAQPWRLLPPDVGEPPGRFHAAPDAWVVKPSRRGSSTLVPGRALTALPVLATPNIELSSTSVVETPGGDERPADLVGEFDVLPVVSAGGTLSDLRRSLAGALPAVPDAESLIFARSDTPPSVLADLQHAGAGPPVSAEQIATRLAQDSRAAQAQVGIVVAVAGLLIGGLAMAAPITRLRRTRAHEEAVLRLMRVPVGTRRAATKVELVVMSLVAAAVVLLLGFVGVMGFLANAPLLEVPLNQPPVEAGVGSAAVVIVIIGTACAAWFSVLVIGYWTRRVPAPRTDPALLREGAAP